MSCSKVGTYSRHAERASGQEGICTESELSPAYSHTQLVRLPHFYCLHRSEDLFPIVLVWYFPVFQCITDTSDVIKCVGPAYMTITYLMSTFPRLFSQNLPERVHKKFTNGGTLPFDGSAKLILFPSPHCKIIIGLEFYAVAQKKSILCFVEGKCEGLITIFKSCQYNLSYIISCLIVIL